MTAMTNDFPLSRQLTKIFDIFTNVKALVIGDVMLDTYIFGSVSRISPEAPVPIVNVENTESRLGGAANVAMNIKALGGKVVICSVTGNDAAGKKLSALLDENGLNKSNIITSLLRITTEKTRVFSRNQQMLRYDHETENDLSSADEKKLIGIISQAIESGKFNVVVLQDYNKGVLTPNVIHSTISICNRKKIPVTVDPKKKNFFEYRNVTLFKPNLRELNEALKTEIDKKKIKSLEKVAKALHALLNHQYTFITLSESGAFITDHKTSELIPASLRNIADVSGAGDTVLSVASMCIAAGVDFKAMAKLSNIAGGLACAQVGVAPINKEQFYLEAEKAL